MCRSLVSLFNSTNCSPVVNWKVFSWAAEGISDPSKWTEILSEITAELLFSPSTCWATVINQRRDIYPCLLHTVSEVGKHVNILLISRSRQRSSLPTNALTLSERSKMLASLPCIDVFQRIQPVKNVYKVWQLRYQRGSSRYPAQGRTHINKKCHHLWTQSVEAM